MMKWFKRLFRRKPDPLAVLREPIPYELVISERAALHEDCVREIVTVGSASLSPHCNVAPGTYGAAVMDAVMRGYMRPTEPCRPDYVNGGWTRSKYEATQLGRNQYAQNDKRPDTPRDAGPV